MDSSFKISAFADELGPEVDLQVATLKRLGVQEIQLRAAWGVNVMELSGAQLSEIRSKADDAGLGFHAIGSPIGKSDISSPQEESLEAVRRASGIAETVNANRVRVFSFYFGENQAPEGRRQSLFPG